ncbi:hypothetical protein EJ08DRAFT_654542 [Tothia fuscella]|uniref:Uncharacterized protein n=1 Tax=Tothia fuscella TaxID=1048955 RepID=A0A9P4TSR4_9PEZI|nr:hypothetical protein EJ08DRAFT_654542 [Tothia fuscella]
MTLPSILYALYAGSGILIWVLIPAASAQFPAGFSIPFLATAASSSTPTSLVGPPKATDTTNTTPLPTTLATSTAAAAAEAPNSTAFPLTATSRVNTAPQTTPNRQLGTQQEEAPDRSSGLLNYYFVFLALFILLLFIGAYFVHRRKRAMKARYNQNGQNALARDLDGWQGTRRWIHGNWRPDTARNRAEGLNELGEAPPPYKPGNTAGEEHVPQLPLATLSRGGDGSTSPKLPGYGEAVRASRIVEDADRPPTAFPGGERNGIEEAHTRER